MRAIRPYILVQTNPQRINKGQPLTISARLFDRVTNQPLYVRKIYLNIISTKDGHTVWPMEVVRKDSYKFDILIGTDEMKPGHNYLVRVSNNRNLSPLGATEFQIVKDSQIPIALFPIPLPVRQPDDSLNKREIKKFTFRTQMDARVCPLCLEHQNEDFLPTQEIPKIPVHFNCRCTYDVTFKDEFEDSFQAVQDAYLAANVFQHKKNMLKIVNAIEGVSWIQNIK